MSDFVVGTRLPEKNIRVARAQVPAYAEASGDNNPIHLDETAARSAGLPGVIAHGMISMGLLGNLAAEWAGAADRVRLVRCRFAGILMPEDTLTFRGEVQAVEGKLVRVAVSAVNQRGEDVLTRGLVEFAQL